MTNKVESIKEETLRKTKDIPQTWTGDSRSVTQGQEWDKAKEMDFTYTNLDKFIRLSLGENANFSNAMYDGNYSLSLEEAQKLKYDFVARNLNKERFTCS